MKKKIAPAAIGVLLLLALTLIIYTIVFLPSARQRLAELDAECRLIESQIQLYDAYLQTPAGLTQEIEQLQASIDEIREQTSYDEFHISFAVSDAVKAYDVNLLSLSMGAAIDYEGSRAIPVHLSLSGSTENILQFLHHFETDRDASYVSRGVDLEIGTEKSVADVVMYVCIPGL